MRRLVVTAGVVALLTLTACSSGSGDKTAASATTTVPPSIPSTTTTLVVRGSDQASTPFCKLVVTYTQQFAALLPAAGDPTKLKAATTDAESAIRQAQASAPAEIKPDVTVVATTASQVLTALQKNNFDITKTPEVNKLQDPGFQTSFANVNRYAQAHCGLTT
jgi:hypothetical protein